MGKYWFYQVVVMVDGVEIRQRYNRFTRTWREQAGLCAMDYAYRMGWPAWVEPIEGED